jgi:putative FmdB family regulatory protein
MPLYEYYCSRCEGRFDLLRPSARMDDAAACPAGHTGGKRVLSSFAAHTGASSEFAEAGEAMGGGGGGCGGCAGGACACSSMN